MELDSKTIGRYLGDNARRIPDETAVIYEDLRYTWKELENLSAYMAYRMFSMGITRGTHVGIWSVNTPNWIIVYLALVKVGAVPVLINTCYRERELTEILCYADVEYLYYGENYKDISYSEVVGEIERKGASPLKKCIYIGRKNGGWLRDDSFVGSEKTLKAVRLVRCLERENGCKDVAGMLFTSGTTSRPKGVMLTHRNLINTAWATIRSMRWTREDRICITVPLFHCFGLTSSMLTTILLGSTMCVLPYFRTAAVLGCVEKYRCTVLNGVPSMFLAILKNPRFKEYDVDSLRSGIIAGSPIYQEDYIKLSEAMPGLRLIPSYGQTETSPAVTFGRFEDPIWKRGGNAGKVLDQVELRIVNPETMEPAGQGQIGEIQVKGYNVMKEYYNMPEETKKTRLDSGWLRTGDLGYLDEEGYLYLKGRNGEMIIRAGENIAPCEIEAVLREIPWIADVKVMGVPAEVIQEKVIACVILEEGRGLQEAYIREYLAERIAHYKIPEQFLIFEEFPVTASGKIRLDALKELVMKRLLDRDKEE